MTTFKKVLIANRGEIAVRIAKTLQQMGIQTVAVYSDVDQAAAHVVVADEAYPLGGTTPQESYLDSDKMIAIAKNAGVDAIHPGYGFLSENAGFATACADAGIVFIGPSPEVIHAMGDKVVSKETMEKAGVPTVPGWVGDVSDTKAVEKAAEAIGYPVLVKAAAGGGGKGMRLVEESKALKEAVAGAAREAKKAFDDDRVFLEKYVTTPRHIEFQIFGDSQGNMVHLFERECSIQRRHQKIIEETPSPALTPELRERMGEVAVQAAKAVGYINAGTVEFILDADNQFYFLEMNTRLQVEHPVTEWITQQDLVRAQIMVAQGGTLPFTQADLFQHGHAIECRIYAEDPSNGFLPATGTLHVYEEPVGPGIRVDSGVRQGDEVSIYYDPMLAKLVTWGADRTEAMDRMQWALAHYPVLGVTTNIAYLGAILADKTFQSGQVDTHFTEHFAYTSETPNGEVMAMAASVLASSPGIGNQRGVSETVPFKETPWETLGAWRGV